MTGYGILWSIRMLFSQIGLNESSTFTFESIFLVKIHKHNIEIKKKKHHKIGPRRTTKVKVLNQKPKSQYELLYLKVRACIVAAGILLHCSVDTRGMLVLRLALCITKHCHSPHLHQVPRSLARWPEGDLTFVPKYLWEGLKKKKPDSWRCPLKGQEATDIKWSTGGSVWA